MKCVLPQIKVHFDLDLVSQVPMFYEIGTPRSPPVYGQDSRYR